MPHSTSEVSTPLAKAHQPATSRGARQAKSEDESNTLEKIASLERKLKDTTDLLHMWMNEAHAYRLLAYPELVERAESIVSGRYTKQEAQGMLETYRIEIPPNTSMPAQSPSPFHDASVSSASSVASLNNSPFNIPHSQFICLPSTKEEHQAFTHIATFAQLEPYQFLWSCLDTIMSHADDELLLAGCYQAATKRFEERILPDWAK